MVYTLNELKLVRLEKRDDQLILFLKLLTHHQIHCVTSEKNWKMNGLIIYSNSVMNIIEKKNRAKHCLKSFWAHLPNPNRCLNFSTIFMVHYRILDKVNRWSGPTKGTRTYWDDYVVTLVASFCLLISCWLQYSATSSRLKILVPFGGHTHTVRVLGCNYYKWRH